MVLTPILRCSVSLSAASIFIPPRLKRRLRFFDSLHHLDGCNDLSHLGLRRIGLIHYPLLDGILDEFNLSVFREVLNNTLSIEG